MKNDQDGKQFIGYVREKLQEVLQHAGRAVTYFMRTIMLNCPYYNELILNPCR